MFGLSSSAGVFGAVADMLVAIYKRAGFTPIIKWVDDFLVIRLPGQTWSEEDFMNLTARAGVPWSQKKLRRLASTQRYIGFDWDLKNKVVSLPPEKMLSIGDLLKTWASPGASFSEREAASLHGKLVHCSSILRLIRPFLRSIARFSQSFRSSRAKLHPSQDMLADISWIRFLLPILPSSVPLASPSPVDLGWWGDASTSFGIGIVLGKFWAVGKWAPGFQVGPHQTFTIGWAEAVAVELALRLALQLDLFIGRANHSFLVRSDNEGVVTVLSKGRSRCRETNRILKQVYLLQARSNILLHPVHVPSKLNIADALSRGDISGFLRAFPAAQHHCSLPIPDHLVGKLISL
jgi:hypothetical protein